MIKTQEIKAILDFREQYRDLLFPRGYLLTDDNSIDVNSFPFYGLWNVNEIFGFKIITHSKQKIYIQSNDNVSFVIIGHAYNPISKHISEDVLLEKAIQLYCKSEDLFIEYFNQWTGVYSLFIFENNNVRVYGDATCMYMNFYGTINGNMYCSSHSNLIGCLCRLEFEEYVKRLVSYKHYNLFGKTLPGDISPYKEIKRLIPNHFAQYENGTWCSHRFFALQDNHFKNIQYDSLIKNAANILSDSLRIIYRKWEKPAISLTGGCDSKTTLSCANGVYDKYLYFSYASSESEAVDAKAAESICKLLKLPHILYKVSDNDDYEDLDVLRRLIDYNCGSIGETKINEIRKRVFFRSVNDFDVEVKSWVSEIGRAYYHKRFLKKSFPKKLTPRYATCLYKVLISNRKLMQETDKIFEDFINMFYFNGEMENTEWYDTLFWEFRVGSWNGLVITGEHHISYDIEIPYNNRVLLQCFLAMPLEKRIDDIPHKDIMRTMNTIIYECGIAVTNLKHTKNRAKLERLYLEIFSRLRL